MASFSKSVLEKYIKDEVAEPKEVKIYKEKHRKDLIRAQRIIVDSIKDHLISKVSSKKNPKEMYDSLSRMYEGRNVNRKMKFESSIEEYQDETRRIHSRLLHKGLPV